MDNIIFRKPLHLICSSDGLRTSMNYIYFKDEFAWATNAHTMIKFDLKDCGMNSEECKLFSGRAIHMEIFKQIIYKKKLIIDTENKIIYCMFGENKISISDDIFYTGITDKMQVVLEELLEKHNSSMKQAVDFIGIDFKLIKLISSVFPTRLKLCFSGKEKGIIISDLEHTRTEGIIMPIAINH